MSKWSNEYLLNNEKVAEDFDKIHNTTISQSYKFPFNLSADEIWEAHIMCKSRSIMMDPYPEHLQEGYCAMWNNIVNNLSEKHFPYNGVKSLPIDVKEDILSGMASHINVDDIVYYSIKGVKANTNADVNREVNNTFPVNVTRDIQWVISPKTLEKMKSQIKERKDSGLSLTDIAKEI